MEGELYWYLCGSRDIQAKSLHGLSVVIYNLNNRRKEGLQSTYGRCWSSLHLGFDAPGQIWSTEFAKNLVGANRVQVLRVYEKTIHVKETCSNWRGAVKR